MNWAQFGYDVANFNIPKTTQMKSNYLKPEEPIVEEKKEDEKEKDEDANVQQDSNKKHVETEEEKK